jgi:uncharacterized protein YcfJ
MTKSLLAVVAGAALAAALTANAQVTFYSQEGFRGQPYTVNWTASNFAFLGYNDRASSAIVENGDWEVCEDADYGGRCTVLRPGQYPSLNPFGLNNRISSVRPVSMPVASAPPPPPPPPPQPYTYYQRHGEALYTADVVATRAVVGPPEQRCWVEQQQVQQRSDPNIAGAIIGGVLGGVLGHQIGSGRGNDVATAVGAVGGAAVGSQVGRNTQTSTQDVQRCAAVPGTEKVAYWDVTYVFNGVTHRAQLSYAPGATITVNAQGEPRV